MTKPKTYKFSELKEKFQLDVIKDRVIVGHFKTDMTIQEASDYFDAWNRRFNKIGVIQIN